MAAGLRPDPLGELKRSPRPPSRNKGPTSKGREREGRERGGEGGEGEGKERKGKGKGGQRRDMEGGDLTCAVLKFP